MLNSKTTNNYYYYYRSENMKQSMQKRFSRNALLQRGKESNKKPKLLLIII